MDKVVCPRCGLESTELEGGGVFCPEHGVFTATGEGFVEFSPIHRKHPPCASCERPVDPDDEPTKFRLKTGSRRWAVLYFCDACTSDMAGRFAMAVRKRIQRKRHEHQREG